MRQPGDVFVNGPTSLHLQRERVRFVRWSQSMQWNDKMGVDLHDAGTVNAGLSSSRREIATS